MTTPQELYPRICEEFPDANFELPPLVSTAWAAAIEDSLALIKSGLYLRSDAKLISGYPILQSYYLDLTGQELRTQKELAAREPSPTQQISSTNESFVHANYHSVTKDWIGLLVIEGELIAETGGFPDIASAKRKYQAYLGHYKAGFKTKEQLKDSLSLKSIKDQEI
jgi:hypothetical protein